MLPPNSIIPYDSTHASIPTGFTRDARFDDRFVKGAKTALASFGGTSTHTHSSAAHSHTMVSHTHTMKLYAYSGPGEDAAGGSNGTDTGHSHWGDTPKTSTAMSGGTLSNTVTYPASSSLPAYYSFIFIKANSYISFPTNGIILTSAATRTNASFHAASASKHMRGASSNADAGTTGGTDTHTHDVSHTHTGVVHSHTGTSEVDSSNINLNLSSGNKHATGNHSHTLYWENYTLTGSAATLTSSSGSSIPLSKNVNLFKVTTPTLPIPGDIVLTIDETVPLGWITCDGNNGTPNLDGYYLRNKASAGAGVTESGANTHTHAANNSHSHGTAAHTHTASTSNFAGNGETGVSSSAASQSHSHQTKDSSSNTASWNSTQVSASSEENQEPPYIKVQFIQYLYSPFGAAAMMAMGVR